MLRAESYDSIVVGAGPNGLAAAITMAHAGRSVLVVEAKDRPGGCVRSDEGTLPGFVHDTCAAVFPLACGTPFFGGLSSRGLPIGWVVPPAAVAHPFDDGTCLTLSQSIDASAQALGEDGGAWLDFVGPYAGRWRALAEDLLQPLLHVPRHPALCLSFCLKGLQSAQHAATRLFATEKARALFAGLGAHSILPLDATGTAAFALFMAASAHATGWPMAKGGAGRITDAIASYLRSMDVGIEPAREVHDVRTLPYSRTLFFDLTPRQILEITGKRLPFRHRIQLGRYRYGPGVCKVDWALAGPIPWAAPGCREAGTVHLGGSFREVALSERRVWQGMHPDYPFVVCGQPSLFDPGRAPEGRHVAWAYCHVPNGSHENMAGRIERQVERFAPGFTRLILARRVMTAGSLQGLNSNLVGGDIAAGTNTMHQLLFRPVVSWKPYAFGWSRFRVCSASSPPGAGVHGMCGYNAARHALADIWGIRHPEP